VDTIGITLNYDHVKERREGGEVAVPIRGGSIIIVFPVISLLMHTQMATSAFSTTTVEVPASLANLTTYNTVVNKLNRLWEDQLHEIQHVTDVSKG